jgi:hypothetical protein
MRANSRKKYKKQGDKEHDSRRLRGKEGEFFSEKQILFPSIAQKSALPCFGVRRHVLRSSWAWVGFNASPAARVKRIEPIRRGGIVRLTTQGVSRRGRGASGAVLTLCPDAGREPKRRLGGEGRPGKNQEGKTRCGRGVTLARDCVSQIKTRKITSK